MIKRLLCYMLYSVVITMPMLAMAEQSHLLHAPAPFYPIEARSAQQQGFIEVQIEFNLQGEVIDIDILASNNKTPFIKSVLYSVSGWKMSPSDNEGRNIKYKFDFNLSKTTQLDMAIQTANTQLIGRPKAQKWDYQKYKAMKKRLKHQYSLYIARKHAIVTAKGA